MGASVERLTRRQVQWATTEGAATAVTLRRMDTRGRAADAAGAAAVERAAVPVALSHMGTRDRADDAAGGQSR